MFGEILFSTKSALRPSSSKEASGPDAAPPPLGVVQHFDERLKRLVPE
jgi:hypothetical protein